MSNSSTEWTCSSCSYSNYSSRSSCFKCGTMYISSVPGFLAPKSQPIDMKKNPKTNLSTSLSTQQPNILGCKMNGTIRAGLSTKILPGDWICPNNQCQLNNFAARVKCIQCGASHAGAVRPVDRAGDWSCPNDNCRFHNFASRKECHRCGTKKVSDKKTSSSLPCGGSFMGPNTINAKTTSLKAGDWICQRKDCGSHNFAKRDSCFQCGHSPMALDETTNRISVFGFSTSANSKEAPSDSPVNMYLDYGQSFFSCNPFSPYGFGQHQT